jgi:POT family proton-dependent oligopeptide transporter
VPYIVGNEAAERFSFYGMRAILVVFMTKYMLGADGQAAPMTEGEAKSYFHLFVWAVYFFPLAGAVVADAFLGKYKTIISLSIVYCLGHLTLALDDTWLSHALGLSSRLSLAIGLSLIAIGSGGIKPCVSANVGDQFGPTNQHLLSRIFGWFYFSINLGSTFSMLLTPYLLDKVGPQVAFGTPGFFMLLATWIFWLGRRKFVHIAPAGMAFIRQTLSRSGLSILGRLSLLFIPVLVFWSLYDQSSSAWVLQAKHMNLHWLGRDWLPAQIQAVNPALVMVFIPLFSYAVYPGLHKIFPLTPLRKISIGLFLSVGSFLIPAWVESQIAAGLRPSIGWQVLAYVVLTAAEIMVSITCLEFAYTQAPHKMKSLVMCLYLLAIAMGNAFTAAVNFLIQAEDGTSYLEGADYYLFFTYLMVEAALLFVLVAQRYKEQTYIQQELGADMPPIPAAPGLERE